MTDDTNYDELMPALLRAVYRLGLERGSMEFAEFNWFPRVRPSEHAEITKLVDEFIQEDFALLNYSINRWGDDTNGL